MGTPFDEMDPKSYRSCDTLPEAILQNRQFLEDAFTTSADALDFDFLPLPSEWWDFRFPPEIYEQYQPLSDQDLTPQMQMTRKTENGIPDFEDAHFRSLLEEIVSKVNGYFS